MSELHWTGAALLLAVAIRKDRPTRPQRDPTLLEWGGLRPSASPGRCPPRPAAACKEHRPSLPLRQVRKRIF